MSKTLLKMFAVLVVLGVVIISYMWLTATRVDRPAAQSSRADATPPAAPLGGGSLGAGDRPWIRQYDGDGDLAFQFRASDYQPRGGNVFDVREVECEFLLRGGRLLRVKGSSGQIVTPAEVMERQVTRMQGQMAPPTSGVLRGVVIELFDAAEGVPGTPTTAPAYATEPTIFATLDNLSFDNETFRIFTDRYTDDAGNVIPADRVPIVMTGKDLRFEGYGLTVRLNERDRQLALLEVRHGKRLVLNRPGRLVDFNRRQQGAFAPLPAWWQDATAQVGGGTAPAGTASPEAVTEQRRQGYRAVLMQDVRASQGEEFTATGDELSFLFSGGKVPGDEAQRSKGGPTRDSVQAKPSAASNSEDGGDRGSVNEPEVPVVVTWSGPLRVTSDDSAPAGDDFEMSLVGKPAVVLQAGNVVKGARLVYQSVNDGATLVGDATTPLVVTTPDGATISSETVRYSGADGKVRLDGRSRAQLPIKDGGEQKEVLASWTRTCVVTLKDTPAGKARFSQIGMSGDVKIDHPRMLVQAGKLDVEFDGTGDEQGARRILASDGARFSLADTEARLRELTGKRVEVLLERPNGGSATPKIITATGDAVARDAEQSLSAGELSIELETLDKDRKDIWVPRVVAQGNVLGRSADGSRLTGDRLEVTQPIPQAGQTTSRARVEVRGRPLATVETEGSILSGAVLIYDDEKQTAEVVGSGRVVGRARSGGGGEGSQPFEATWADGMKADLAGNKAEIRGNVFMTSKDEQGAINTATARRVEIELANTAAKTVTNGSAERSNRELSGGLGAGTLGSAGLGSKELRGVRLVEEVRLQQVLTDAGGTLLRQLNFNAGELRYDPTGLVESSGPGVAGLIDRRSSGLEQPGGAAGAIDPASARGTTALGWKGSFRFDPSSNVLTLREDVRVAFMPAGETTVAYQLASDALDAEMTSTRPPAAAEAGAAEVTEAQLSRVRATGNMVFTARGVNVFGESLEFDPTRQVAEVKSAPGAVVEVIDSNGQNQGKFSTARFNLKTGQIDGVTDFTGEFRPNANTPMPGGQPRRVTPIPPAEAPK